MLYIYIYVYIYIYMCVCGWVRVRVCTCTRMYEQLPTFVCRYFRAVREKVSCIHWSVPRAGHFRCVTWARESTRLTWGPWVWDPIPCFSLGFIRVIYANDRKIMAIRANTGKYGSLTAKTAIRGARFPLKGQGVATNGDLQRSHCKLGRMYLHLPPKASSKAFAK